MRLRLLRALARVRWATLAATFVLMPGPRSVDAQSGRYDLLVTSNQTHSVKRYDGETGEYLGDFIESGTAGLRFPQEVLLSPDGHLYVTGFGTSGILKFHGRTGAFVERFSSGFQLSQATKMAYGPGGDLYVSQWAGSRSVVRFDGETGAFVEQATPALDRPMQPAWSADGTLHVVSFGSLDVRRFTAGGDLLDILTEGGPLEGPVNLWFDDEHMYVLDWQGGTVERYDPATGAHVDTFIGGLIRTEGWAYGPDGRLYLADWSRGTVNAYHSETGDLDEIFIDTGGLREPNSLLFFERQPDFGLTLSRPGIDLTTADVGSLEISVLPDREVPFEDPVALSCSGLPVGFDCTFAPPVVVPGTAGAGVTLTVARATPAAATRTTSTMLPLAVMAALLSAIGLAGWWAPRHRIRSVAGSRATVRRRAAQLAVGCALVTLGCAGDPTGPGRELDSAIVTVEGVSDPLRRTVTFVLSFER